MSKLVSVIVVILVLVQMSIESNHSAQLGQPPAPPQQPDTLQLLANHNLTVNEIPLPNNQPRKWWQRIPKSGYIGIGATGLVIIAAISGYLIAYSSGMTMQNATLPAPLPFAEFNHSNLCTNDRNCTFLLTEPDIDVLSHPVDRVMFYFFVAFLLLHVLYGVLYLLWSTFGREHNSCIQSLLRHYYRKFGHPTTDLDKNNQNMNNQALAQSPQYPPIDSFPSKFQVKSSQSHRDGLNASSSKKTLPFGINNSGSSGQTSSRSLKSLPTLTSNTGRSNKTDKTTITNSKSRKNLKEDGGVVPRKKRSKRRKLTK